MNKGKLLINEEKGNEEEQTNNINDKKDNKKLCNCNFVAFKLGLKTIFSFFGRGVNGCCGVCCYPVKERLANNCEQVDRELNPYKDPNYNPYDYL